MVVKPQAKQSSSSLLTESKPGGERVSVGASVTHLAMLPAATLQSMSALKREAHALLEY